MQRSQIIHALRDKKVVEFTKKAIISSYCNFFIQNKIEARNMINESFMLLEDSQKIEGNDTSIYKIADYICSVLFKKRDNNFWFNKGYREYKFNIRSKEDYKVIAKYIKGPNVLDFGSNGGHFALELYKHNYNVFTTDILDHREPEAKHLFFNKMDTPTSIPFKKNSFNTVIVKTVFHHIPNPHLHKIIKKLSRITLRLIVKEDVYSLNGGTNICVHENKSLRAQYNKLNEEQRYLTLVLMDFFGNVVASGIPDMSLPFNFKSVPEWKYIFSQNGFVIKKYILTGFEKTKMHPSLQAWFVLDRQ
jgi:2-polyprenyl-3-methyl-5-hydroxy-6-metoxy-1,4-benzoquinol methylase